MLQNKTSKIINDMAKIQQKSEEITAFGGIFFIRAVFSVFFCGGDCMEDLNLYLKDVLTERPHTRVPSAGTVLRGIEELATENISYTAECQELPCRLRLLQRGHREDGHGAY